MDFLVTKSSGFSEMLTHHPYSMFPDWRKSNFFPFSRDSHLAVNDFPLVDDDFYSSWSYDGEETGVGVINRYEHMEDVDKHGGVVEEPCLEGVPMVTSTNSRQVAERGGGDTKGAADMDVTSCSPNLIELRETGEPVSEDTVNFSAGEEALLRQAVTSSDISIRKEISPCACSDHASDKTNLYTDVKAPVRDSSLHDKGKLTSYESDSASLDSLPDIVDADPDSD